MFFVIDDGLTTRKQGIVEITGIHTTDVGIMLGGLVQKNMLIPDGYGRGMTYKINEDYLVTQDGGKNAKVANEESKLAQKIIRLIQENNKITQQEMANMLGCSKRTVLRNMSNMKNVHYVGSGFSGHWQID